MVLCVFDVRARRVGGAIFQIPIEVTATFYNGDFYVSTKVLLLVRTL